MSERELDIELAKERNRIPDCKSAECQYKACVRLDSPYCFTHSVGVPQLANPWVWMELTIEQITALVVGE